jgi:hypothetical protein
MKGLGSSSWFDGSLAAMNSDFLLKLLDFVGVS